MCEYGILYTLAEAVVIIRLSEPRQRFRHSAVDDAHKREWEQSHQQNECGQNGG